METCEFSTKSRSPFAADGQEEFPQKVTARDYLSGKVAMGCSENEHEVKMLSFLLHLPFLQ